MRLDTITTKVYKFSELSEEAQEKALESLSDINTDHDWWDMTIEDETASLALMGYNQAEINFTGFNSQGDGASFTADVDLTTWLKAHKLAKKYAKYIKIDQEEGNFSIHITREGNYSHEMTMRIEFEYFGESLQTHDGELENLILEDAREQARKIYRTLEKEYEYLTSREQIIETIEANEYEFTESGKLY